MKKNVELQEVVQSSISVSTNEGKTKFSSVNLGFKKHSKKIIYIALLSGVGLFFTSCEAGYVASEPSYIESTRPSRPSDLHIWIDGDWRWDQRSNTYKHNDGSWQQPRHGRTFVAGHWQSSPKGNHWVNGHWEGHSRMMNHVN